MLTAELVRGTRRAGELKLSSLSGRTRERALEIAEALLETARAHVGRTRDELKEGLAASVFFEARERKLMMGLAKLVDDACEFTSESSLDPEAVRARVFELGTQARRALGAGARFDRDQVLRQVAGEFEATPEQVEGALFADLKGAHVLTQLAPLDAPQLLERYAVAERQAVLLRAVRVTARVVCQPDGYRRLFRALKFRRLLFEVTKAEAGGYQITIDGPFSLFDSVTKYGLNLALALPALEAAEELDLSAELRWGKARDKLTYRYQARGKGGSVGSGQVDELAAFVQAFERLGSDYQVAPSDRVLDLPGLGVVVPDLVFTKQGGEPIYLELLGFWSRDAVWHRVELARAGLPVKIVFAASSRLRVSEANLEDVDRAELYLFKGALSAKAVLTRLERLDSAKVRE